MEDKQQKIDKIREFCIAANPSIKDLGWGCNYHAKDTIPEAIYRITDYYPTLHQIKNEFGTHVEIKYIDEIIGREIHLADVLLAIGSHTNSGTSGRTILIDSNSGIFVEEMRDYNKSHQKHWNLLKDSLSDQPEPTLDFIISLLDAK